MERYRGQPSIRRTRKPRTEIAFIKNVLWDSKVKSNTIVDKETEKTSEVESEKVGINIPNATKTDYDICLECEFDTWADVDTYQNHPEHLKVAAYIAKCRTARAAVDYEF